ATREVRSNRGVAYGSQEVSCDPLSPHHAGGAPAPEFLADNHSELPVRGGAVCPALQVSTRPSQSHAPAQLPGVPLADGAAPAEDGPAPRVGAAVLLREDVEASLSPRRHAVPEGAPASTVDPECGGDGLPHRGGGWPLSPHDGDDAVRDGHAERGTPAAPGRG